jgi:hypothetical protein
MAASQRETRDADTMMVTDSNSASTTGGSSTALDLDGEMVADGEYKPAEYFFDR